MTSGNSFRNEPSYYDLIIENPKQADDDLQDVVRSLGIQVEDSDCYSLDTEDEPQQLNFED